VVTRTNQDKGVGVTSVTTEHCKDFTAAVFPTITMQLTPIFHACLMYILLILALFMELSRKCGTGDNVL
jgi:hypothetical protein